MRATQFLLLCICCTAAADFGPNAPRYWPKFSGSRDVSILDGEWEYGLYAAASPNDYDPAWPVDPAWDSMNPSFVPKADLTPNKTNVPACMDLVAGGAAGYLGPRGVAMYKTTFASPSSGDPVRLQFQACSFYCRVWVNGKEIGDHRAGGYVAFHLDVPKETLLSSEGDNELFVLADNRFNATTAPMHTGGDFWHYGGLMRSVELHTMASKPVLWRAYVLPVNADVTDPKQSVAPDTIDITLQLSSAEDAGSTVSFTVAFDGGDAVSMSGTVTKKGDVLAKAVKVPNAQLWSNASPKLHTVAVTFRGGTVTERFGLRSFGADASTARFTLNGNITKLVGWNHHTQWPVTAASPTDKQMDDDVALLKKGNANYVRGAHYPHDPRWMDRLDEAGE
jgi:beta-glucuronidase